MTMSPQTVPPSGPARPRLMTATEVADYLRLSRSCVYKLSRLGRLRSVRVAEGACRSQRRWLEADLQAYLERQAR